MERIVERPGALDVHKASVTACVRVWRGTRARASIWRSSQRPCRVCWRCADWLEALRVTQVAMEATGVYWKPVWAILEDGFELTLVNAGTSSRSPAARPTSRTRSGSASCWRRGCCAASFVPPKPIRTLRNLTRYRKTQIPSASARPTACTRSSRTPDQARLRRLDILGDNGRAMLDALVAGTHRPRRPRRPRAGPAAKKIPALREALEGRFEDEHALIVRQILADIDFLEKRSSGSPTRSRSRSPLSPAGGR